MNNCIRRYFFPIFLFYVGFILLGTLIGLIIGLLFIFILIPAIIIGFFIGFALALIAHAIVLLIVNKNCYRLEYHPGC